jgi:hypothetical protein
MRLIFFTIVLALGLPALAADSEVYYVQATRAELRKEPKTAGPVLARLSRGDAVSLLSKKEIWFEVRVGKAQGWVPRLFLSQHPPVGASELSNLSSTTSLEKASRRRPASFSVSASTRGLMISDRARRGQEKYQTDYQALVRLEEREWDPALLDKFRATAKLPD